MLDGGDAELGAALPDQLPHDHGVGDDQLDGEVALAPALELDERARQHELGDRVARGEADRRVLAGQAARERVDRLGLHEQLARLDVQPLARRRGEDAPRRAVE